MHIGRGGGWRESAPLASCLWRVKCLYLQLWLEPVSEHVEVGMVQ